MRKFRQRKIVIISAAGCVVAGVAVACALMLGSGTASASERLIQPMSAVVPSGQLLKIQLSDSKGNLGSMYLVDPAAKTCVHLSASPEGGKVRPFGALYVYTAAGVSSLSGVTLETRETTVRNYSWIEAKLDWLGNQVVREEGTASLDGREVIVVRGQVISKETGQPIEVKGYLDPVSGIVVREESRAGDEVTIVTRQLVSPAEEELSALAKRPLSELASKMRRAWFQAAAEAKFPVLVLPEQLAEKLGVRLASFVPSGEPDYVSIDYWAGPEPQDLAIVIRIWDLDTREESFWKERVPLEQAVERSWRARPEGSPEIAFQQDNAGVKVEVIGGKVELSAEEVARMLVPIKESGLLQ